MRSAAELGRLSVMPSRSSSDGAHSRASGSPRSTRSGSRANDDGALTQNVVQLLAIDTPVSQAGRSGKPRYRKSIIPNAGWSHPALHVLLATRLDPTVIPNNQSIDRRTLAHDPRRHSSRKQGSPFSRLCTLALRVRKVKNDSFQNVSGIATQGRSSSHSSTRTQAHRPLLKGA
jgi:hypothetical protein